MKDGRWLEPRYTDRTVFEKDFPVIDLNGLDVYCPGCRKVVRLLRKSPNTKIGAWCKGCSRAVTA
ncbi:MAG: hypothetical protein HY553_21865 [Elusimicrobia bacterium]|nr:hypothetical protein [Elusimicrobiota bacterium]